ncbi:MAG: hypothetical protein LBI28_01345 [Treponema sp.]|jgi:hypothetical protein|nr:hypothetical protein [Treponema sp.]
MGIKIKYFIIFNLILLSLLYYGCKPRNDIIKNNQISSSLIENDLNNIEKDNNVNIEESMTIDINNFIAEIKYLNGTWLPKRNFEGNYIYEIEEREFSWGLGQTAIYDSFDIDITGDFPFIHPPAMRPFSIINIIQIEDNTILLHVNAPGSGLPDDWYGEIFFYFDYIDTIRIKAKWFSVTFTEGNQIINPFDGTVLWNRLSGNDF